ncbi:MAG: hemerythrin family protein [Victivallaceae bacterium]|jgi:hemerythrin
MKLNKASIRTGVDLIDKQHFKYFSIVNAVMDGLGDKEQNKTLFKDLNNYVIYHFKTEEDFMNKYNYDKMDVHVKQHDYFRDKIKELTKQYSKTSDFDVNVKMKISCLLIDWFVKHIQTVDKHLCEFILTQSAMDSGIMAKLKSLLNRFTAKHGEEAEWE